PARPRWRSPSRRRSTPFRAMSCRSRSSCRSPSSRTRTSRTARTTIRPSPTISSSATPSRPAASTSPRRKSWANPKPISNILGSTTSAPGFIPGAFFEAGRMDAEVPLFRMEGISKRYGGVRALEDAELEVHGGRVHAVLGENGAGKSTLIKIMAGVVAPDSGRMSVEGREVSFPEPAAAIDAGVACIFQELSLIPDLSVADNIVISNPPKRFGLIDRRAQRRIAEQALARAGGEDIHPMAPVKDLPLSRRQIVEIAKALARQPRILILDQATSALTAADVIKGFPPLKRLQ